MKALFVSLAVLVFLLAACASIPPAPKGQIADTTAQDRVRELILDAYRAYEDTQAEEAAHASATGIAIG